MDGVITIILFLIIIGVLVFVHEFGHFAAAKLTNVPVKEFAIGFGPKIFEKKYGATKYQLRLIPLGGFVSLEGEDDKDSPNGFRNQKYRVKLVILLGGIFMNLLFAVVVMFLYLNVSNHRMLLPRLSEHSFSNVSSAEVYKPIGIIGVEEGYGWDNIEFGDAIVAIEGQKTNSDRDLRDLIEQRYGEEVEVTILDTEEPSIETRKITVGGLYNGEYLPLIVAGFAENSEVKDSFVEGETVVAVDGEYFKTFGEFTDLLDENQGEDVEFIFLDVDSDTEFNRTVSVPNKNDDGSVLGVSFIVDYGLYYTEILDISDNEFIFYNFDKSLLTPVSLSYDLIIYQVDGLIGIFSDAFESGDFTQVGQSVGSPVAVGKSVEQIVLVGNFTFLIFLTGLISLSLAMFNILPIPALDGGQVALVTIEKFRRKQFSEKTIQKVNAAGFIFLMSFSVLLIAKDLVQFEIIGNVFDSFSRILGR